MSDKKIKRSETDIITQSPIEVTLGGKKYKIAPLVLRKSMEWRKKYTETTAPLFTMMTIKSNNPEEVAGYYKQLMIDMPEEAINLFLSYATELDRDIILDTATEKEFAEAFKVLVEFALPLTQSLPEAMDKSSQ